MSSSYQIPRGRPVADESKAAPRVLFKDIEDINYFRVSMGLKPIHKLLRNCLRCERKFEAHGSANRMCDACRSSLKGS